MLDMLGLHWKFTFVLSHMIILVSPCFLVHDSFLKAKSSSKVACVGQLLRHLNAIIFLKSCVFLRTEWWVPQFASDEASSHLWVVCPHSVSKKNNHSSKHVREEHVDVKTSKFPLHSTIVCELKWVFFLKPVRRLTSMSWMSWVTAGLPSTMLCSFVGSLKF